MKKKRIKKKKRNRRNLFFTERKGRGENNAGKNGRKELSLDLMRLFYNSNCRSGL
ncbi:MAG: hypothetical protein WC306_00640 [Candidatus Paceibacterota bacterium]|jgi:hypothetical protein